MFLDPILNVPLENQLLSKVEAKVPKQIPSNYEQTIDAATGVFNAMSTSAGFVFLLNIFFGFSLKFLWKAVNVLQFIIYTGDWKLSPPSNLEVFFKQAAFFARGEWLPKDQIMTAVRFKGEDQEDEQIRQMRFLIIITLVVSIAGVLLMSLLFVFKKFYACRHLAWAAE